MINAERVARRRLARRCHRGCVLSGARQARAGAKVKPMLAAKSALSEPPTGPGWLFERKFDGVRALAGLRGGQPFVHSREGADITHAFPEVLSLLSALPWADVCLDGEIVGRDLSAVAWRVNLKRPGELAQRRAPCRFVTFDLLAALQSAGHPDAYVPHTTDGVALWALAIAEMWEGVMAKRPGKRSADRLKVKVNAANRAA